MRRAKLRVLILWAVVALHAAIHSAPAWALTQGYSPGDFIVADYGGKIAVFDPELAFKNYLDTSFTLVAGLDFTSAGELVAVGRTSPAIRRYNPQGVLVREIETAPWMGLPIDLKVGPGDRLYLATQTAGVAELTLDGTFLRSLGPANDPQGLAVLPNGELWVGHGTDRPSIPGNPIDVYSLASGALVRTIPMFDGQRAVGTMTYSPTTNTVLMTDESSRVYERRIDGSLVRQFNGRTQFPYGVTRTASGDVYVTGQFSDFVARHSTNGVFLGTTSLAPFVGLPINILQVPVPEPGAALLACWGLVVLRDCRRARRGRNGPAR